MRFLRWAIQQNLDITIASGPRKINDIARISLYSGETGVRDRKYLTIQPGFCMGVTDQSLYRVSLYGGSAVVDIKSQLKESFRMNVTRECHCCG